MVTVALFGGSFDPPHVAHQMACVLALASETVEKVWLVPTFEHAFGKAMAPFDDRVAMCELAARPFGGRVEVSRIEEEVARARGAESRTYHTLVHLAATRPEVKFRLLVGEDILAERDRWHRWDDVARMAPPLVVGRTGAEQAGGPELRLPAIASSVVRERLRGGETVEGLLPAAVMGYIAGRGLYR